MLRPVIGGQWSQFPSICHAFSPYLDNLFSTVRIILEVPGALMLTKYQLLRWLSRLHVSWLCFILQLHFLLLRPAAVPPCVPACITPSCLCSCFPSASNAFYSLSPSSFGQFSLSFKTCPRHYLLHLILNSALSLHFRLFLGQQQNFKEVPTIGFHIS